MNVGELNKRIEIKYLNGATTDDSGFNTNAWVRLFNCWARVQNVSGKEFVQANQENNSVTTRFTIRKNQALENYDSKKLMIIYQNKNYNVRYINPMDSYVEILGEMINSGS